MTEEESRVEKMFCSKCNKGMGNIHLKGGQIISKECTTCIKIKESRRHKGSYS